MELTQPSYPEANKLPAYLASVAKGSNVDLRSPLYGRSTPREEILNSLPDDWFFGDMIPEELKAIEAKEKAKIGPYSIRLPYSEREPQIMTYFKQPKHKYDQKSLNAAVEFIIRYLGANSTLRTVTLDKVVNSATKNTNWGLPYFDSGKNSYEKHFELARDFLQTLELPYYPSVLGWRGQPNGTDKPKQRTVWIYPHYIVLLELMYQMSFLAKYRSHSAFVAWNNNEMIDAAVTKLINLSGLKVSFDAAAFDANTIAILIQHAFYIFGLCFQQGQRDPLISLEKYFRTSGLVTPSGTLEGRQSAVPSGSGLTNLIDCLIQLIIAAYVCIRGGGNLNTFQSTVLGDDGIWYWDNISKEMVTEFSSELGVEASLDKNYSSESSAQYLQRLHTVEIKNNDVYPGIRSLMRTVNSLMSYERIPRGLTKYLGSIIMIMKCEQAANHPFHPQLVNWVMKGDELQLGKSLKGGVRELVKLSGGVQNIKQVLRLEAFPFTERDPRGIASFATTRVIEGNNN